MQTQNRLFDDLARMANGALGAAAGVRGEIGGLFRQQFERVIRDMDLVTREEFEVVRAMAEKARMENEALSARLAALEGAGVAKPAPKKKPAAKVAAKAAAKPASRRRKAATPDGETA